LPQDSIVSKTHLQSKQNFNLDICGLGQSVTALLLVRVLRPLQFGHGIMFIPLSGLIYRDTVKCPDMGRASSSYETNLRKSDNEQLWLPSLQKP